MQKSEFVYLSHMEAASRYVVEEYFITIWPQRKASHSC